MQRRRAVTRQLDVEAQYIRNKAHSCVLPPAIFAFISTACNMHW